MNVSDAVSSRRSVRGFLDKPVEPALLESLLRKASAAPSGGNIQPWHIHVVAGAKIDALKRIMAAKVVEQPAGEGSEYDIYPRELIEPYRSRTFQVGEALYERLGIPREDKKARARWFQRNFQFFGAPIGLFCYVHRNNGPPQWSDLGMYLQTLMLLLREEGLDSCPQECWAIYPRTISEFLGTPPEHMLFTGMAIGWKDPDEPANSMVAARAPLEQFAHFHT
ncbi:nitroreductase [Sphingobium sp. HBC34]|uniref:Nitroreductase n=1 Tax=Sphingobium cyanobacteriorum TaxID=3063954 RepID=A0ABT8ZPL0_9SPHN|nr:nitroreductase [Sphingobium sp. HBC34]MDO7836474.1 nitroreductase [Sphingobium sp. HBC34]